MMDHGQQKLIETIKKNSDMVLTTPDKEILHLKADTLSLIGFLFGHNLIDTIRRKSALLCHFLHVNTLCVRGRAVIQVHSGKQYFLLFFGKVRQFYRRDECNHTFINFVKQFIDKVGQADIPKYLVTALVLRFADFGGGIGLCRNLR